jgi:hypothetical protein
VDHGIIQRKGLTEIPVEQSADVVKQLFPNLFDLFGCRIKARHCDGRVAGDQPNNEKRNQHEGNDIRQQPEGSLDREVDPRRKSAL